MKISPLSIFICGVAVALIAFFYGAFIQYIPNMADVNNYEKNTQAQNDEAAKQKQAEKRVLNAIAAVKAKDIAWQRFVATRTPSNKLSEQGIDLSVNAYQLGIDTYTYRDNIQRAVNKQLRSGGVKVLSAPTIQMLDPNAKVNTILTDFYNYPAIPFPVVIFDFGTITVQGTYSQIMNHLRAYKEMPNYLAVSDGLTLTGTSPLLTANYNLSIVGFIRGKNIYPPVSEENAAAAGGAGGAFAGFGGGRGGPPPGFGGPGGPPAGFGGPGAGGAPDRPTAAGTRGN